MECRTIIARILRAAKPKAKSLLVTILGDAMPRRGEFALGALLELAAEFGVGERLARTAAARLTREGWLITTRCGRRGYCRITPDAREQIQTASARIYAADCAVADGRAADGWDGKWRVVLLAPPDNPTQRARREKFKRAAEWQGFARWGAQALIHPRPDLARFAALCAEHGLSKDAAILCAKARPPQTMNRIAAQCWNAAEIESRYRLFVRRFAPLAKIIAKNRPPPDKRSSPDKRLSSDKRLSPDNRLPPEIAFRARILAIHEYRRALLRDPGLPYGGQAAAACDIAAAIRRAANADYAAAVIARYSRNGDSRNGDSRNGASRGGGVLN